MLPKNGQMWPKMDKYGHKGLKLLHKFKMGPKIDKIGKLVLLN